MPTKCPRLRRKLIKLGIVAAPVLAWAAVILIVPTEWARTRLSNNLSQATGCPVRIGSLWMGMFGSLRMRDIVISEDQSSSTWLVVPEAHVDVHLGQVLLGRCAPGEIRLLNPSIRLERARDGSWAAGRKRSARLVHEQSPDEGAEPAKASTCLVIEGGNLDLIDQASGLQFALSEIAGRGTVGDGFATVEEFRGMLNGGRLSLAAHIEHEGESTRFEADLRTHGVVLDQSFSGLAYLAPIAAGGEGGVRGTLELHLAASGGGRSLDEALRTLQGNGSVMISPLDLEGSKFLSELDILDQWDPADRVGVLSCDFSIGKRRISTENLCLRVDRLPLVMAGWTDFDGRYDYGIRTEQMTAMVPRDAKGWLKEMGVNFDELKGLRIQGTTTQAVATLNGHPLLEDPKAGPSRGPRAGRDDEHSRLRESARRIRDRLFR
ncbi:AsmA-like C-terminal region-containing protein [Tundrisphaera sp. TA3]|uniref:hypothetical protein n=1 Tax=Tundrisphaera sp. TA3 TaxID=3435775 RepID=UPI003EB8053D